MPRAGRISLPIGVFEVECFGVLRDGALGLIFCAAGEIRLNLDGDVHLGVRVRREGGDDFVGDGVVSENSNEPNPLILWIVREVWTWSLPKQNCSCGAEKKSSNLGWAYPWTWDDTNAGMTNRSKPGRHR